MEGYVFVTNKGEKYHNDKNCIYIKGKKFNEILISEARNKGKLPCKGCYSNNNNNNNKPYNNNNWKKNYNNNKNQNIKKVIKIKNNIKSEEADDTLFNHNTTVKENEIHIKSIERNKIDYNNEDDNLKKEEMKKDDSFIIENNTENIIKEQNTNNYFTKSNILNESDNNDTKHFFVDINNKKNDKIINNNNIFEPLPNNQNIYKNNNFNKNQNLNKKNKKNNKQNFSNNKNKEEDKKSLDKEKFYSDDDSKTYSLINKRSSDYSGDINFNSTKFNAINFINNNSKEYKIVQYSSLNKKIMDYNNYNLKLNCQRNDMLFLIETYYNAKTLLFGQPNYLNKANNTIDESQIINGNGLVIKDSFKYIFEINH